VRRLPTLLRSLALLLGGAGAATAFQVALHQTANATAAPASADAGARSGTRTDAHARAARHHRPARHRRWAWAPCPTGSTLEAGTCVTDVVRTVTLQAAPAVDTRVAAPVRSAQHPPPAGHEDGDGDDGGDGGGGGDD
jgi:hypothetical protein